MGRIEFSAATMEDGWMPTSFSAEPSNRLYTEGRGRRDEMTMRLISAGISISLPVWSTTIRVSPSGDWSGEWSRTVSRAWVSWTEAVPAAPEPQPMRDIAIPAASKAAVTAFRLIICLSSLETMVVSSFTTCFIV